MNVEDNLDSNIFYDFWQLSGYAVVLCRNLGHNLKIITIQLKKWYIHIKTSSHEADQPPLSAPSPN